jgi:hypothetical protein
MHSVQLLHTLGTAHSDVACPEDLAEVGALHKAHLGKDVLPIECDAGPFSDINSVNTVPSPIEQSF